ncbi:TDE1717 family outer membrane beta-barrel protein [Treponema denticola]|uniref:TDE1717 family outer membrane beta-barrel protein n=1 Tax=Treponema denticola TaxID=158 RepID=UPI0020A24545|nr:outer membrane beta-barrel protein [Treponema denticola]UTC92555.1 outer membrane beta-barrel protein [Treponema denticola]
MKKLIFVFLLVALLATPLAALDFSAGGDFSFAPTWNTSKANAGDVKRTNSMNFLGFSGFFDAEYVRAGLGLNFSVGGLKTKLENAGPLSGTFTDGKVSLTNFRLSVLGKYPFTIAEIVKLYPLAGMEVDFNISSKYDGKNAKEHLSDDEKSDLNHYYLVLGAGADITVTGNLFVTPKATFGFDLRQSSTAKAAKAKGGHTMKIEFGVGVGYKF